MKILYQCIKNSFLQDIRYPVNFLFGILTPVFTVLPALIIVGMYDNMQETSYYIIGIIIWMFISQIIWGNGVILKNEKQKGTLTQVLITPTNVTVFVCVKSIYFIIKAYIVLLIGVLFCNIVLNTKIYIGRLSLILLFAFPLYYGFSILISAFCIKADYLFAIIQTILGILMILSGLTYEMNFSKKLVLINNYNPVFQIISISRKSLYYSAGQIIFCREMRIVFVEGILMVFFVAIIMKSMIKKYMEQGL